MQNAAELAARADHAGRTYFPTRGLSAERLSYSVRATADLDDEVRARVIEDLVLMGWQRE